MQFSPDIEFTKNQAYHAAAILFFYHLELPDKFPQLKDSLHAGWMACFKHPMNYEELLRPLSVGESAYNEDELNWCMATSQFLIDSLDPAGWLTRGIPESAVKRCGRPAQAVPPPTLLDSRPPLPEPVPVDAEARAAPPPRAEAAHRCPLQAGFTQ
jgi:hypothetical protein